ncbi:general secretion pathway protein GspB [Aliiglaciecola lipolytica]|uniref:General secretion pathway protein B n=1 Tax=Aliiglaciecola lipolytica E3 TaxID=1127673 RepID=K6XVK7_9ALTE|nr:general secretion pathway protein GspB [Aliiglaciecola lipolytica]GAC15701.1 general secretion pathway protein B [Aliiglaciecola lipolytica E3]
MTKIINIEQLKTGMVIIKVTAQNGPVKIKKSGLVSSDEMVKALAEMGVQEVEVDPDMTVEIKKPKIAKSKTQQLVEDTSTLTQNIDQGISEQFNRSLFLPSVQELPEAWQYYGKKSFVVSLVVIGGFCLGLILANINNYTHLLSTPINNVENVAKVDSETSTNDPQQVQQQQATDNGSNDIAMQTSEPIIENDINDSEQLQSEQRSNDVIQAQQSEDQTEQLQAQQREEKEQLEADEEKNIPPELLQRFRNALASIGDETPTDPTIDAEPIRDVPAVNELPAWVLTELPSLAFSTHMYVSTPTERWVRVNGKRAVEGQEIDDGLILVGIEPQHVILKFKGQEFSMDALSDW